MEVGDLSTKIKLVSLLSIVNGFYPLQLQDALTTRNKDIEFAEENNQQLLTLLEKYDSKLDEMQDAIEIKEIERLQLEEQLD